MLSVGHIANGEYEPSIPDTAVNKDILFIGQKGSGKTVAIEEIEKTLSMKGFQILIFNVDGTHDNVLSDVEHYNVVKVKEEGIPMPLLECFSNSSGGAEDTADICESVVDVFAQMNRLGYIFQNMLMEACENAAMMRAQYVDDMKCLYDAISLVDGHEALVAKYHNVFKRVKFLKNFDLWKANKATILDFSGYSHTMQLLLSQLVLSVIWRYHRIYGQKMNIGTWLVLDEFQNMPLQVDSLLAQILREGRKYNLSLFLATQTLSVFDVSKRALLQQVGTKLYFRPVETDLKRIAKSFVDIEAIDAENILRNLKIGECLAYGEFDVSGKIKKRTLKISFDYVR